MEKIDQQLGHLLELLRIEREEEIRQHKHLLFNTTIPQRIAAGICWYPLEIKETGYGLGDYPYVIFQRNITHHIPHKFSGGKVAGVFSNIQGNETLETKGVINFVDGNRIKIIFYANELPDWIDDGKIGINLLFDENTFIEMEQTIKKLIGAKGRLAELKKILYNEQEPGFEKLPPIKIPHLNFSQEEAVNNILAAEDVAIIHGPPGTGKTTTLVEAISQTSKTEKSILVCAPSNTAVDLLTEKLAEKGLNVVRLGNLARVDENILKHTLDGKIADHPETKEIKIIKKLADEYRRMAHKYKRNFGKEERLQRNRLMTEARNLGNQVQVLENYAIDDVLSSADVITCTFAGSSGRYLENRKFRTVFIDEAAQALEPATWIPILKAHRVILAGDPYQLPPTVKSMEAAKGGLSITLIEKGIKYLPKVSLLKVQYRMNGVIMGFSNREFYQGALTAHESVINHLLEISDNDPLEFIDTAGCGFDEKLNEESLSLFNPEEFYILQKHLSQVIHEHKNEDLPSIGVISPYKEQVIFMKENMEKELISYKKLAINTIDSFQGQERDIIYISLVRSNSLGEIGFLADYRRMNVAMTRARKKLIVIGDSATLGSNKFYTDFIDYCQENGKYRSAWELMTE